MKRLINVDDITKYRPASKAIPLERLDPFISEAQEIDLMQVLGESLHYDFMSKFDTGVAESTKYQELLNGKVYTPPGQQPIEFNGLKPMLVYFTLARFYQNNPINVTRFGLTQKVNEESTPLDARSLSVAVDEVRSIGINYQTRVVKFLSDNATTYPLFGYSKKEILNTGGVKFFDI